jgi:AraC-like DNA-binding protein
MPIKPSKQRIAFSRPPHLPGVQVLIVDDCEPRIWRAYHETFTTSIALRAEIPPAAWVYRGKTHFQNVGGLQLIEPGETHSNTKQVHSVSFRVLMIPPAVMEQAFVELDGRSSQIHFKTAQTFDPRLFAAFRALHSGLENDASILEQQSRFAVCLRLLAQECAESPSTRQPAPIPSAAVKRAKGYLTQSFRQNISLEELAGIASVSRFHLLRRFKQEIGIPPHAFQVQLKLSAARESLRKGWSIAESAADAGFSDQSHFTRLFKQFWGATPRAYSESTRPRPVFLPSHRTATHDPIAKTKQKK